MRQQSDEKLEPVSVYVPTTLLEKISSQAKKERRSISAQIVVFLEKALSAPSKG